MFNIRLGEKNRRKCSTTRQFFAEKKTTEIVFSMTQANAKFLAPVSHLVLTNSRRERPTQIAGEKSRENEIIIAVGPYMKNLPARHNLFMCVAWSEANVPSRKLYPQIMETPTTEQKKKNRKKTKKPTRHKTNNTLSRRVFVSFVVPPAKLSSCISRKFKWINA